MRLATLSAFCGLLLSASALAEPVEAENHSGEKVGTIESSSVEVTGDIKAVTVFRGQALVTRLVKLSGSAGLKEIVVTKLPDQVIPGSIYAESADGVEVRSVRYRARPVGEDVRAEVREIEDQIEAVQAEIAANTRYQQLAKEHKSYLDSLQKFVATTANVELTKGVLDANTLKTLTEFLHAERKSLAETELQLQQQQEELQEKLNLLNRRRQTVASGSAKTVREAIIFVNQTGASGGQLRVRYLVNNANWTPSYNVRTDGKREKVLVEYNASIQQLTGENWDNVEMTLSTATPSLVAAAPDLNPLKVTLTRMAAAQQAQADSSGGKASYFLHRKKLERQRRSLDFQRNNSIPRYGAMFEGYPGADAESGARMGSGMGGMMGGMGGGMGMGMPSGRPAASLAPRAQIAGNAPQLNKLAEQIQMLELKVGKAVVAKDDGKPESVEESVSVTYELETPISLPSRSDRQLIQIAAMPMPGEFRKIAVPVLTAHVYDQASVVNDSKMVLLAGPSSSFVDGRFVGHGTVPSVTVGEKFTVGFGIDSSLRAHRELVDKNETIQGGNRIVEFTYRLAIENFSSDPAKVRLSDRIPTATGHNGEINVTLVSPGQPLADDPEYLKDERKKGILRWIVEVPGDAIGAEAFSFKYTFKMEYDKQMKIAGAPSGEKAEPKTTSRVGGGPF